MMSKLPYTRAGDELAEAVGLAGDVRKRDLAACNHNSLAGAHARRAVDGDGDLRVGAIRPNGDRYRPGRRTV